MCCAWGGLVYALGYTPWTQARQQVLAQQQAIASAENQAQDLANQLRLALAEHAALENKARAAPIARHELADRIGDALAGCALSVHNLVVGQATEADGLSVTPVDVQASGRFEEIVSWLGKVRQDLPGVSVVGLSVLPQPSDESMLMVQASLKAYAPQTTPPAGDQGQ